MSLIDFAKPKASRVIGIDASTRSLAFAVIDGGSLEKFGEITLTGNTFYDRLIDCRYKSDVILGDISVDYVAIEKAIMVRSTDVALKLGMIIGVVISSLSDDSAHVEEVAPITWQSYIGNPNIIGKKKADIVNQFPDKGGSWISNYIRDLRKQKTMDWANNKYGVQITSDNVSDAVGVATYVAEERVS